MNTEIIVRIEVGARNKKKTPSIVVGVLLDLVLAIWWLAAAVEVGSR